MNTPEIFKNKTVIGLTALGLGIGLFVAYKSKSGYVKKALIGLAGGFAVGYVATQVFAKKSAEKSVAADDTRAKIETIVTAVVKKADDKSKATPENIKKFVDLVYEHYQKGNETQKALIMDTLQILNDFALIDESGKSESEKMNSAMVMLGKMQGLEAKYGKDEVAKFKKVFDEKMNSTFA